MIRPYFSRRIVLALGLAMVIASLSFLARNVQAAPQSQSDQSQGQGQTTEKSKKKGGFFDSLKSNSNSTPSSDSTSGSNQGSNAAPNQGSTSNQQQNSNKGGFFQGMKAATGSKSQQASASASMGTKGVGEGAAMGNVTPTAADRQAVTQMETYSVGQGDLSKFIEAGHLKPRQ